MSVQGVAPPNQRSSVALISGLSNLSIQYNFAVIAIALAFMDNGSGHNGASPAAAYPRDDAWSSLIKSLVFAGAITGQLTMGLAGDVLGRRRAMLLTNSFSIVGALGTALFTWGSPSTMYAIMGACRFLLGVGVGGKYPLAASMSQEDSGSAQKSVAQKSYQVAKGFFWQTVRRLGLTGWKAAIGSLLRSESTRRFQLGSDSPWLLPCRRAMATPC